MSGDRGRLAARALQHARPRSAGPGCDLDRRLGRTAGRGSPSASLGCTPPRPDGRALRSLRTAGPVTVDVKGNESERRSLDRIATAVSTVLDVPMVSISVIYSQANAPNMQVVVGSHG